MARKHNIFFINRTDQVQSKSVSRIVVWLVTFCLLACFAVALLGLGMAVWRGADMLHKKLTYWQLLEDNRRLKNIYVSAQSRLTEIDNQLTTNFSRSSDYRLAYGLEAVPEEVKKVGIGGFTKPGDVYIINNPYLKKSILNTHEKTSELLRITTLQDHDYNLILDGIQSKLDYYDHTPSIRPARGKLTSLFGLRQHPIHKAEQMHRGIDIANRKWTPIVATADGIVLRSSRSKKSGIYIVLRHGYGLKTYYLHLSKATVTRGQNIKRGQIVGYMGRSGTATGTHLHYEIRKWGKPVDPTDHIITANYIYD